MRRYVLLIYFFIFFFLFSSSVAFGAFFKGLGKLSGDVDSYAYKVSPDGHVVVGDSGSDSGLYEAYMWSEAQGMFGLGFASGDSSSTAWAVSQDGTAVVGGSQNATRMQAFRWTESGGMLGIGFFGNHTDCAASDTSSDGNVLVGVCLGGIGEKEAFRWTASGGIVGLGHLSGDNYINVFGPSVALGVSSDGSTVVGYSGTTAERAFKWTAPGGMESLPLRTNMDNCRAYDVSNDGSIVVGHCYSSATRQSVAVLWKPGRVIESIGDFDGGELNSVAIAVSGDGSVVAGFGFSASGAEAFIWDTTNGLQNLKQVLTNQFALDLTGWTLLEARSISNDGKTIVGTGTNPAGNREAWVVNIALPADSGGDAGVGVDTGGGSASSGGGGGGGGGCFINVARQSVQIQNIVDFLAGIPFIGLLASVFFKIRNR
jgi:probable HAF family extracellular repeat protein